MAEIHYKNTGVKVPFKEGTEMNLLRYSIRWEARVPYKCGGGLCGTCKVRIEEGAENLSEIKKAEIHHLGDKLNEGYRLACQTFAKGSCTVSWDSSVEFKENKKLREYWEKSAATNS